MIGVTRKPENAKSTISMHQHHGCMRWGTVRKGEEKSKLAHTHTEKERELDRERDPAGPGIFFEASQGYNLANVHEPEGEVTVCEGG